MNGWRHQLPVRSPVSMSALLRGAWAAAARNGVAARAEARVAAMVRERYGAQATLLTDSGTTALTAALLATLEARPDGKVALPAYGCYDLATATDGANARVLLYDVDPRTLAPDLTQLESTLRRGAAAVVVVHFYGYPVDLEQVNALAATHGAVVIEDAAQALGSSINGHPAGSQASLAVLSFGRGKGLTGGSGGVLLAHDASGQRLLDRARALLREPTPGWSELLAMTAQFILERPNLYALPSSLPWLHLGETIYRPPRILRRPTSVSCPMVAACWQQADRETEVRQRNAERLLLELRAQPGFETFTISPYARPGYLRLPVLASPFVRRLVAAPAARRLGIMPGYPEALCDLAGFRSRCLNRNDPFPGSRMVSARLCTLPTHSRLGTRDFQTLAQWIRAVGGHNPARS